MKGISVFRAKLVLLCSHNVSLSDWRDLMREWTEFCEILFLIFYFTSNCRGLVFHLTTHSETHTHTHTHSLSLSLSLSLVRTPLDL
jgi:hypothetical protein